VDYIQVSGVQVSRVVLGCGGFGGIGSAPEFFGAGESRDEAFALMDAAYERGITTFDTADAYGGGRSETFIGEWLRSRGLRDRVAIITKTFNPMSEGADSGLSRTRILRQVDTSLRRLGVERIDLYLAHEQDPATPIEETLAAMDELVRNGKIRAFGTSNAGAADLAAALAAGPRLACVQNSCSLLDPDDDVLDLCQREGLGYLAFGPLAGGWLTGKYRRDAPPPDGSRMTTRPEPYLRLQDERVYSALDRLAALAHDQGTTMAALALSWVLARPGVTATVIGPRRPEHIAPAIEALTLPPPDVRHLFPTDLMSG
jgi:aryl-alcohol dehydrogenase-like predicted oxidoreductase